MNPIQNRTKQESSMLVLTPEMEKIVKSLNMMELADLPFHLRAVHDHVVHHSTTELHEDIRTSLYYVNWLAMAVHGAHVMSGK